MRRSLFFVFTLLLLISIASAEKANVPTVEASSSVYQGDLILTGNNVTTIEDRRFDINGSIIVEENATLILKNAVINFTQTYSYQHNMTFRNPANGNPRLQVENATMTASDYYFYARFHGNSVVTASKLETVSRMMLRAEDLTVMSISSGSSINNLHAYHSSTLYIYNSTISYLANYQSPTVQVYDSEINYILIGPTSIICTVFQLEPGLINYWGFMTNCSVNILSGGSAPNITLTNTMVPVWSFTLYGSSSMSTISSRITSLFTWESSLVSAVNSDITTIYARGSSDILLVNSTYSQSPDIQDQARIQVAWYLDATVIDSTSQAVPSTNVTATYENSTIAESKLTDADGWARLTLMEKMMNATGEYPVGNYTVEASYWSYSDDITVNMTGNNQIILTLGSFVLPTAIHIMANGSVDPSEAPVQQDGNLYTLTDNIYLSIVVERDNIVVDGASYGVHGPGSEDGIYLSDINNVTIKNMEIESFDYIGIHISNSSKNIISGNKIESNIYGIRLDGFSDINIVSGNNITANEWIGIWVVTSSNNTLSGNTIANNNYGIRSESSSNNSIHENKLTNNDYGIYLETSTTNFIYHNNFVNNTDQVYIDDSPNFWDNSVEGNYWSNYTGVDSNHDGIGDSHHIMNINNSDHYPLMGMFSDHTITSERHVQTICNSSISDFSLNGTAILFNVTGADGTGGFCRICIPKTLMTDSFRVLINGTEILPAPQPLPCSNNTHTYLYFSYTHSTQEVIVIPEFPSFLILPLIMIGTLVAAICRRNHNQFEICFTKRALHHTK